jgi:hypothetical protein
MSVGVGPFRFYGGRSRRRQRPSAAFGRGWFVFAMLVGLVDGIYGWATKGFASFVATIIFCFIVGLIGLAKSGPETKPRPPRT